MERTPSFLISFGEMYYSETISLPVVSVGGIVLYQQITVIETGEILMSENLGVDMRFAGCVDRLFNKSGDINELS